MTQAPARRPRPTWLVWVTAALLLLLFLARLVDTASEKSLTVDEPHYVARGLYLWETGDYHFLRGLQLHPPLAYHLASVPLLWFDAGIPMKPNPGYWLLEEVQPGAASLVRFASRLPFALVAAWGGLLVFLWAREAAGPGAGLLALFLYSFSPTLLAHGAIAHSDLTVSVFYLQTLYTWWRWTRRPSALRAVVCGVSLGLALLSKLSAIALLAALGLLVAVVVALPARAGGAIAESWPEQAFAQRARRGAGALALLLLAALAVVWLGYGGSFALADDPDGPLAGWRLPGYLRALLWDVDQNVHGRNIYFLGELSKSAPWTFFPVAFALKLPVGTLILTGLALALLAQRRPGLSLCVGVGVGLYAVAALSIVAPLGIRYALPVFPLLFVFLGTTLAPAGGLGPTWRRALVGACLAWIALASLRIHPHYLAHFNELAGGPAGGQRFFVESNLDWGQDLGTLREWIRRERPAGPLWLAYFGAEPPGRYGIEARKLPGCRPVHGTVAISANVLVELYHPAGVFGRPPAGCYAWLRERPPVARPGWSIFVYQIPKPEDGPADGTAPGREGGPARP